MPTFGLVALGFGFAASAMAQTETPTQLAVGVRASSETHTAGDRFVYSADLEAGRSYLVEVDQNGLDLLLNVEASGGEVTYAAPLFRDGSEYAVVDATETTTYRFVVFSEELTAARASHAIMVAGLPAEEAPAWRAMARAAQANRDGDEAAWRAAVAAYDEAAMHWRALGRPTLEAEALFAAATVDYWQLYAWQPAVDRTEAAAGLYANVGMATEAANSVHLRAAALVEIALETKQTSTEVALAPEAQAQFDAALALLGAARVEHERLGNVYDLGLVVNNFGYTYYNMGRFDAAREAYREAAALLANAGETTAELNPRYNLALLEAEQGYLSSAIETFERILEILPPDRLDVYRSATLDNLGAAQLSFGNAEEALAIFAEALDLQSGIDDRQGRGRSLRRIGQSYQALGDLELAGQYLDEALPIAEATNDGRNREATLRALGDVAHAQGDYEDALQYHERALETAASVFDRAELLVLISEDLLALGRTAAALRATDEALAAAEESNADTLRAAAALAAGRAERATGGTAVERLTHARDIYARLGLATSLAAAEHELALALEDIGRLDTALEHADVAVAELERLRARVADPELRAFLAGTRRVYFETEIRLRLARHAHGGDASDLARAFEASERARARLTADLLQEASVDLEAHVDPALKRRERALYSDLAEASYRHGLLVEQGVDDAVLRESLATLSAIENELNLLEREMRRSSPSFASLGTSGALTANEVQNALDPETVLLQYELAEPASHVWVVTHERIEVVELASGATIENAARRVIDELSAYTGAVRDRESLEALSALVLAPVAERLDRPRIALSLDGALQYAPFVALPLDTGETLLSRHELVEVPSMSTVAALRERSGRAQGANGRTLALFADPVVGANDPRLDGLAAIAPETLAARARTTFSGELGRLQSTAYEADVLTELVAASERLVARGFDASRSTVLEAELDGYRYIHFATHGLVDARYPGLSALALSEFDRHGTPQDGLLRLHDIYNLDIDADLVVLSACETALGREIRGEGLIGLTQGFLYAGARSVMASLWQVPDRATAELMTRFYGYLLEENLSPTEALRRAQLDVAAVRRWRDPYFWAGFVLIGDWR